ncbi:MAG: hypothetical protein GX616_20575 [Planctomycetes bacterium]|nr:hypothetical protein [Planctomycetota bacterium]
MNSRVRHLVTLALTAVLLATGAGCPKQSPNEKHPAPISKPPTVVEPPAPLPVDQPPVQTRPVATKPAESRPVESQPASTYDPSPPYRVKLFVRNPSAKQPGWLRILKLNDENQTATAEGLFPEQNDINVTTGNVQQIEVHISFLPLAPRKRTFLRVDSQVIEIVTKDRKFVVLERSPAGVWNVVPQKK